MLSNRMTDQEKDHAADASDVMSCARCGRPARRHESGKCHDCRRRPQRRQRQDARARGLERAARFTYDYDRDDTGDVSDES